MALNVKKELAYFKSEKAKRFYIFRKAGNPADECIQFDKEAFSICKFRQFEWKSEIDTDWREEPEKFWQKFEEQLEKEAEREKAL